MSRTDGAGRGARESGLPAPILLPGGSGGSATRRGGQGGMTEREWLGGKAITGPVEGYAIGEHLAGLFRARDEEEREDVLGYLAQCDCGQQALTRTAHRVWTCPVCLDLIRDAEREAELQDAIEEQREREYESPPAVRVRTWLPGDPAWGDVDVSAGERLAHEYEEEHDGA